MFPCSSAAEKIIAGGAYYGMNQTKSSITGGGETRGHKNRSRMTHDEYVRKLYSKYTYEKVPYGIQPHRRPLLISILIILFVTVLLKISYILPQIHNTPLPLP